MNTVYLAAHDLLTAYGRGADVCFDGLLAGRRALRKITRFPVPPDCGEALGGEFPEDLVPSDGTTLSEHAFRLLAGGLPFRGGFPEGTGLFLALTAGEAENIGKSNGRWTADPLREKCAAVFHTAPGRIYSGACSSGNIALARAFELIRSGAFSGILVAGCDFLSEFVYSGFSSLGALSDGICRPYDRDRDGLLLGDAAGVAYLVSEETLERNSLTPLAKLSGAALATDAWHVAAPDPEGRGMVKALRGAMRAGNVRPEEIGAVIGHGTGTVLNDAMELNALKEVFPGGVPLVSVKGGTGHVLAASGLLQLSCAVKMLERGLVPPQTNLRTPARDAERCVSCEARPLGKKRILSMNAGFGGLNAVVMLEEV